MHSDDARAAIEGYFKTGWTASAYSAIPVWWENQKAPDLSGKYVALSIIDTGEDQASIGAPEQRQTRFTGTIQVDVLVPENTGTVDLRKMADAAAAIFRYRDIPATRNSGTIVCGNAPQTTLPKSGEKYRRVVRVNFYRDVVA